MFLYNTKADSHSSNWQWFRLFLWQNGDYVEDYANDTRSTIRVGAHKVVVYKSWGEQSQIFQCTICSFGPAQNCKIKETEKLWK